MAKNRKGRRARAGGRDAGGVRADPAAMLREAIALHQAGILSGARATYEQILGIDPHHPDALHLLGLVAQQTGDLTRAVELIGAAVAIKPRSALYQNNFGVCWQMLGDDARALRHFERALTLEPGHNSALNNMGASLRSLGRLKEAREACERAARDRPDNAEAHLNLGNIARDAIDPDQAERHYRRAAEVRPTYVEAWRNLGNLHIETGRHESAREALGRALELSGDPALRIKQALLLPQIMGPREEVRAVRQAFTRNLDALLADPPRGIRNPARTINYTPFPLAYHGEDDRPLAEAIARLYLQAVEGPAPVAPHAAGDAPREPGPLRVGVYSRFLLRHSVTRCYGATILELARDPDFEVHLLTVGAARADATTHKLLEACDGRIVQLTGTAERDPVAIAERRLDALLYLDIGMEPLGYFTAFARLAPLQAVMTGHPVTTGIPNIDWFLSWSPGEPHDGEAHYTERLASLEHAGLAFERPAVPERLQSRAELGLPEQGRLYAAPVKLHKLHPDFDELLARLLDRDPDGRVLLFRDQHYPAFHEQLAARLDRTVPASLRDRIQFLPWIGEPADYLATLAAVDLVLDPVHFGAHSTLVSVFAVGTPIVTWPLRFLRERIGLAFCTRLGLHDCVVDSAEEYVSRAYDIARDADRRRELGRRARERLGALHEPAPAARELAEFLKTHLSGG